MLQPLNIAVKFYPGPIKRKLLRHKIMLKCVTATFTGQKVGQIQWRSTFKRLQLGFWCSIRHETYLVHRSEVGKHDEKHHLGIRLV